ncbi:hypothetical protein B0H10DRAFT_1018693 [Mycena sp. CBHHK59/15]|nr:hypothetical protein B0H10DRAFT_1018693 [Mycena sp. CBHHK59/15]
MLPPSRSAYDCDILSTTHLELRDADSQLSGSSCYYVSRRSRPSCSTCFPEYANSPPHISDAPDPHLQTSQTPPPLQQEVHFPEEMSQLVQQTNASILVLNSDSVVKKKTRKKKKADTSIGDTIEGGTSDKPAKKAKRKRVKNDAGETSEAVQAKPKKRRKKVPKADDTAGEESDSPVLKKRKKASQPVLDPDADPGEEIDPTVVTMSELCTDTGQGRISRKAAEIQRNHLAWKQQSKERRARMKALAEQKKYGRPDEAEGIDGASVNVEVTATAATDANVAEVVGTVADDEAAPAIADATGSGFDYSQDLTASRFTVQVRIGPNGETIIDEESLTVDRTEEVDTTNYVHVVESDNTKFVNSASYTRKCRGSRWSEEETEMFFDALAQHGENYELISLVLPGRNRTACKNKFKAEDRKDSAKVTRYLESRRPIDIQTLGRVTGKDFSGPVPVIRMPTPPPMPDPATQQGVEKSVVVKKRSRSRTLPSTDGVEIIGDAETYDTGNFLDSE